MQLVTDELADALIVAEANVYEFGWICFPIEAFGR